MFHTTCHQLPRGATPSNSLTSVWKCSILLAINLPGFATQAEIRACRAGGHPVLIEAVEDEDDPWGTPKSRKQGGGLDESFI
jgi:hypothetical protein